MTDTKIGVLTVSDRAFKEIYKDLAGPAIEAYMDEHFISISIESKIVPDEQSQIEDSIKQLSGSCCLVITTGGTGPAPRDVTPEATTAVCQKILPGLGEAMRAGSVAKVPTAILSRQTAGICGTAVVVNLPGSPKAIAECLDLVLQALSHVVRLAGGEQMLRLSPQYHLKGRRCDECNVQH